MSYYGMGKQFKKKCQLSFLPVLTITTRKAMTKATPVLIITHNMWNGISGIGSGEGSGGDGSDGGAI